MGTTSNCFYCKSNSIRSNLYRWLFIFESLFVYYVYQPNPMDPSFLSCFHYTNTHLSPNLLRKQKRALTSLVN